MGQQLCQGQRPGQNPNPLEEPVEVNLIGEPQSDQKRMEMLITSMMDKRVEAENFPIPNNHVEQRIKKQTKIESNSNKIYHIKAPFNVVYQNQDKRLEDNLPHGHTRLYKLRDNGQFQGYFEGHVSQNLRADTKEAIYVFPNASYFIGQDEDKGVYCNEVTSLGYEGGWRNGQPQGLGKETSNKGTYEGEYHLGQKEGKGQFTSTDGFVFKGYFQKSLFHGDGKLQHPQNQYTYQGEFLYGEKHGRGTEKKGKEIYEGDFFRGSRWGQGHLVRYSQDSSVQMTFKGFFERGLPHGKGRLTQGNTVVEGIWQQGNLICVQ